jgi:hypothetical protein
VTHHYVLNGDADGLCALQQLRLGGVREGVLVTGVKRDIALLARVRAARGDSCTVLDVSLEVNRAALLTLLGDGVAVAYFDHHHAGEVPVHPSFEPHLDLDAGVCTSLLVDRHLDGRHRAWAITGAFGDNLGREATALARAKGFGDAEIETLRELGVLLNYNAYGETVADLHVDPAELAGHMLPYGDPLEFARSSQTFHQLRAGYQADMDRARKLEPSRASPGALLYLMPDQPWARRAIGVLANELVERHVGSAVALLSPQTGGGFTVSLRIPRESAVGADIFCRGFPSGGGRRTAAGINHLPAAELERFVAEFEREYRTAGPA